MREKYQYDPRLKGPGPEIDLFNNGTLMRLYIRWNQLFNNTRSGLWKPPEGVNSCRVDIPVRNGGRIGGWLLEPEGTVEHLPVICYYHGGAFYMPVLPSSLTLAAHYVEQLKCKVLMPQYRLTPKYPYPAAQDDCCDALLHLLQQGEAWNVDTSQIIIYGESAGGCLAAETTHACGTQIPAKPVGQMLIYPVTDCGKNYPSLEEYQFACWSKKANEIMWKLYFAQPQPGEGSFGIPMEESEIQNLPLTYLETAEIDILRDQGIAYGEKLRQAGVRVLGGTIPGAYHGFDGEMDSPLVQEVLARRIEVMREMLGR